MTVASVEDALSGLLSRLEAPARRQLAREIARSLRQSQQQRIAAQLDPDGSAFAPRKPQPLRGRKGRIRRTMFGKLRTARFLKTEAGADAAVVAFIAQVERLARVHQEGLRDRPQPGRPEVQYPARQLLGFTGLDVESIRDLLLTHLSV